MWMLKLPVQGLAGDLDLELLGHVRFVERSARSRDKRWAKAPRGPRRSARGPAAGGGPWCRSLGPACGRVSWGSLWARPWQTVRLGACPPGGPFQVGRAGARSRLAGPRPVAEGFGSWYTGAVP